MLYIYSAMFLSAVLCIAGIVLSFIDIRRYNFGLYMSLLAIVIFSIALAFFVVKPKACLGPRWFARLFRTPLTTNRSDGAGENEVGEPRRRLVFFGFNTTALFRSELEDACTTDDLNTIPQTSKALDFCTRTSSRSNFHQTVRQGRVELDKNTVMEEPPSTTLIPPTPPSLGDEENEMDKREESEENNTRVRAWTLLNMRGEKNEEARIRAWTFTCASTMKEDGKRKAVKSAECWRQWQQFLLRENGSALMLQSSFPLSERLPASSSGRHDTSSSQTSSTQPKSWSTEEVVNLDEYLGSSTPRKTRSAEKHLASSSTSNRIGMDSPTTKPTRKNALSPMDDPYSWRRAHTITVKYVPVKQEWIPKPLSVIMDSGLYRKKSRSTNAMFTMSNSKEGSPWWSLSNLFQRPQQQKRDDASEELV